MDSNLEIQMFPTESIYPYERSLKIRGKTKIRMIADSIVSYGFDQPIVITEEGEIIKGVGRYEAAKMLALSEVPVIINSDLSDIEIMAARIADNKVAESEWDFQNLWGEVELLTRQGILPQAFGFELSTLQKMFPEMLIEDKVVDDNENDKSLGTPDVNVEQDRNSFENEDASFVSDPEAIYPFVGDNLYFRNLPLLDYFHCHSTIAIGVSGATSIASLLWAIENGLKDRLYVFHIPMNWGVEDPTIYPYLKKIETDLNIKINCVGSINPRNPSCFDDYILQFGFPNPKYGCWLESELRNTRLFALSHDVFKDSTDVCFVLNARWEGSVTKRNHFPDRGEMVTDTGVMHYGNPLYMWTDRDVHKYLYDNSIKLPPSYTVNNTNNCALCPKNRREYFIWYRKNFPVLWLRILSYYAKGARFTGDLNSSILRTIADIDDPNVGVIEFSGDNSSNALSIDELKYLSRNDIDSDYVVAKHRIFDDVLCGNPVFRHNRQLSNLKLCSY